MMRKLLFAMMAVSALAMSATEPVEVLTDDAMRSKVYDYQNGTTVTKRPAVVDLWAPWCGPCRRLAPVVDSLAVEYEGRVDFYKANVDDCPAISQAFRVQSIPMLLLIPADGGRPAYVLGVQPSSTLRRAIDSVLLDKKK